MEGLAVVVLVLPAGEVVLDFNLLNIALGYMVHEARVADLRVLGATVAALDDFPKHDSNKEQHDPQDHGFDC